MTGSAGELGIREVTRRLTRARWVEASLFELTGAWVADVPEPEAKAVLAAHSRHLGWHAQLWEEITPRLWDGSDGGDEAVADVDRSLVAGVAAAAGTVERLVGLYQVALPHLRGRYEIDLAAASATAEAWLARWLGLVCGDLAADQAEGSVALQGLLVDDEARGRAAGWRRAREAELAPG